MVTDDDWGALNNVQNYLTTCCTHETNIIFYINYIPIKIYILKKN